jgi:hypothetical protein
MAGSTSGVFLARRRSEAYGDLMTSKQSNTERMDVKVASGFFNAILATYAD